jgi:hypothetical protein
MDNIPQEISDAIDEVLIESSDISSTFKVRFRQLIINAIVGNLADSDVVDVLSLAPTTYQEGS